ncbi:MAG: O-antigen ligase family protein [Patescibacteria group bacterium]
MTKFLEYGIYFLIFILPFQTRYFLVSNNINGQFWEYGSYTVYLSEAVLVLLLIAKLYSLIGNRKPIKIQKIVFLSLFFLIYIIGSNVWSVNKEISLFYTVRFVEIGLLIWLILTTQINKQKLFLVLMLSLFIQSCLGIWQFFIQEVYAVKWLGIAAQNPVNQGVAVVETHLRRFLRAYGGQPHPNIFGGWLLLGIWTTIFLYQERKQRIQMFLLLVAYSIFFITLVLTFSRSAWLGFVLVWVILLIGYKNWRFKISKLVIIKFLLITSLLSIILGVILREPLTERGNPLFLQPPEMNRLEAKSIQERQTGIKESIDIIKKYPWMGIGIGSYTFNLHILYLQEPVWRLQPVHSIFLLSWSEIGAIGMILLIIINLLLFWRFYQNKNLLGLALFFSFIPLASIDHYLWSLYSGLTLTAAAIVISIKNN